MQNVDVKRIMMDYRRMNVYPMNVKAILIANLPWFAPEKRNMENHALIHVQLINVEIMRYAKFEIMILNVVAPMNSTKATHILGGSVILKVAYPLMTASLHFRVRMEHALTHVKRCNAERMQFAKFQIMFLRASVSLFIHQIVQMGVVMYTNV